MNDQLQQLLQSSVRVDTTLFDQVSDCLVIAPHPDDESLGCGGLIARLREMGTQVHVIFTTDGTMSHPHSQNTSSIGRCKLREQEAIRALEVLGVPEHCITFLRGQDSGLPASGEKGFGSFVALVQGMVADIQPGLVLVPYEFDPHRDHRASWQITLAALENYPDIAIWQYLIWLYTLGESEDVAPLSNIPGGIQYLPVAHQMQRKRAAIAQHQSQLDLDVFEDPQGFVLKEEVLQNFYGDREYYIKH